MVQTVDVIAIFDKMIREPKPVRFKIYDSGHWKSVNVERILNIEWMRLDGKVQIVYSCESRSCNGKMINYKLKYTPGYPLGNGNGRSAQDIRAKDILTTTDKTHWDTKEEFSVVCTTDHWLG